MLFVRRSHALAFHKLKLVAEVLTILLQGSNVCDVSLFSQARGQYKVRDVQEKHCQVGNMSGKLAVAHMLWSEHR